MKIELSTIQRLKKQLDKFCMIYVDENMHEWSEDFRIRLCTSEAFQRASKKVLIFSAGIMYEAGRECVHGNLNAKDLDDIRRLYTVYEFSDHFQMISDRLPCGSILNYLKTGLLTEEEVFRAFFEN